MIKIIGNILWRILYSFTWIIRPFRKPTALTNVLDYSQSKSWYVHPSLTSAEAPGNLQNIFNFNAETQPAVFFIHPTSNFSRSAWNKPVTQGMRDSFLESTIINQATVFKETFKVYIPIYPQATFATFSSHPKFAEQVLDIATQELERAFQQFLIEIEGMPFIIAGHSQGAYHAISLLAKIVIGTNLQKRLIAVYAPGYFFPEAVFDEIGIPLCHNYDSPGCVQTWNVVGDAHWLPPFMYTLPQPVGPRLKLGEAMKFACTNPLNPARDSVPATENIGGYIGGYAPKDSPLIPNLVGATCSYGILMIDAPTDPRFGQFQMSPGWYHPYEYGLFHTNIREDANRRYASWQRLHNNPHDL